jgi:hypothetical protein
MKINLRYLPKRLTRKEIKKQSKELIKFRRLYRKEFIMQDLKQYHLSQKKNALNIKG